MVVKRVGNVAVSVVCKFRDRRHECIAGSLVARDVASQFRPSRYRGGRVRRKFRARGYNKRGFRFARRGDVDRRRRRRLEILSRSDGGGGHRGFSFRFDAVPFRARLSTLRRNCSRSKTHAGWMEEEEVVPVAFRRQEIEYHPATALFR